MARLTALAAFFVALLFIAQATAYRTSITTVDIDEGIENQRRGEDCREQVQSHEYLSHCQQYVRQQTPSGRYGSRNQQEHFQQCCQQLREIDEHCRCEGLRQVVRQQQSQLRGEELEQIVENARNLPNQCRLSPRRCAIRFSSF